MPNRGINTDEVVAYGTAVQVGILSGEGGQDFLRLDGTPSLWGSVQGVVTNLINGTPRSKPRSLRSLPTLERWLVRMEVWTNLPTIVGWSEVNV